MRASDGCHAIDARGTATSRGGCTMRIEQWMLLAGLAGAVALGQTSPPTFGDHPRLEYVQAELDAWPRERIDAAIGKADAVLQRGLVISDKEGQWIFYYACPDHDARLKPEAPENGPQHPRDRWPGLASGRWARYDGGMRWSYCQERIAEVGRLC